MDRHRATTCVLLIVLTAVNSSRSNEFECPTDDDITAYPNPESCKKYYRCTFGVLEDLTCPYTLYFDAVSLGCTFAESVRCIEGTEVEKWDRPICANDGQEVKLVPHQSVCTRYYLCLGSNAVAKRCDDGLLFDEVSRRCTYKEEARCHVDPWCPENDQLQDLKFFSDPEDCSRYSVCYNRKLHYQYCGEGLFFNVEKQECTRPASTDCKVRDVHCGQDALIPHPSKCGSYYDCSGGYLPVLRECEEGYYFDSDKKNCVPNNGLCTPQISSTSTIQTTPMDMTTAPSSTVSTTTVATPTPDDGDGGVGFRHDY